MTNLTDQNHPEQTLSYSDVPFFRKRWMMVVLFLLFIPAMIIITLTGPIWEKSGGRVVKWEDKQRYTAAIAGVVFMLFGLARVFAAM